MNALLAQLQSWPPEAVWLAQFFLAYGSLLLMLRLFGKTGVYLFMIIAVIVANIQVLKPVSFAVIGDTITLGTALFTANFLATDILSEHYGAESARRGLLAVFASFFLFTALMLITLGFAPATPAAAGPDLAWALPNHGHIDALFRPAPSLLIASLTAYMIGQYLDIWLFQRIRRATDGTKPWLRNNLSTALSSFVDIAIFGFLAFYILIDNDMALTEVAAAFVIGPYWFRLATALADTPFFYLSKHCLPRSDRAKKA